MAKKVIHLDCEVFTLCHSEEAELEEDRAALERVNTMIDARRVTVDGVALHYGQAHRLLVESPTFETEDFCHTVAPQADRKLLVQEALAPMVMEDGDYIQIDARYVDLSGGPCNLDPSDPCGTCDGCTE